MIIKKITTLVLLLASTAIFAQDDLSITPFKKPQTKKEVLDSIKATFVHDNIATCIDSMWMKELASLDLYNELTLDIKNINFLHSNVIDGMFFDCDFFECEIKNCHLEDVTLESCDVFNSKITNCKIDQYLHIL